MLRGGLGDVVCIGHVAACAAVSAACAAVGVLRAVLSHCHQAQKGAGHMTQSVWLRPLVAS